MKKHLNRRDFIKVSAIGAGCAVMSVAVKTKTFAKVTPKELQDIIKKTPTYCEMCTFKCAGWMYTKNGKSWKIKGNKEDDHCYGRMCTKGSAGFGTYEDPDRLKTPLIRTGQRGEQVFKEASWGEAFDFIAKKMDIIKEKYGPESVALFTHGAGGSFFKTMLKGYGSPNITAPSYSHCRGPREEGYLLTFGDAIGSPENTDMKNSKCIVLIGSHIGENTHSAQVIEFAHARANGAVVIVVDPRFSTAASKAKYWLPICPSTDIALMLAWINVLINENLYNKEYLDKNAIGFGQLKLSVKNNTPEWAYPITGIKPELIRETAREIARYKPASFIHPGRHNVWYGDDTQRVRTHAIINALLGSWGSKGGFYFPQKVEVPKYPIPEFPKAKRNWKDTLDGKYELANLALSSGICDATIPTSAHSNFFKAWIVYGSNLIKTLPDRDNTIKAIQNLDLLVAIDILPAEITGWADVILPECTYLERYGDIRVSNGRRAQIALRMPAFKPKYNTKPAWWIAKELANRLDLAKYFPWKNIEEYLDTRLKKAGSSLKELQKVGVKTMSSTHKLYIDKNENYEFATDSGKIELYSDILAEYGFDPIPKYISHEKPPSDYFRLLYGRSPSHSFGRTTNNPILSQVCKENVVWINANVAKKWGLINGQYIKLENQDRKKSMPIKVKITQRIRPDAVFMVHGFGHTQKKMKRNYHKGADDNSLITKVKYDPIMGGAGMRSNFVTFIV